MNNCYPGNQYLANKAHRITQLSWYMRNGNKEDYCKGDQVRDIGRRAQGKLWEQPFPRSQASAQLPGKDLFSIHPFHENENRQRVWPDALLDRELCGTEAFFFIFLETAGMGVIYKTPCDSNSWNIHYANITQKQTVCKLSCCVCPFLTLVFVMKHSRQIETTEWTSQLSWAINYFQTHFYHRYHLSQCLITRVFW